MKPVREMIEATGVTVEQFAEICSQSANGTIDIGKMLNAPKLAGEEPPNAMRKKLSIIENADAAI